MSSEKVISQSKTLPEESVKLKSALILSKTEYKNATQSIYGKPTTDVCPLTINDKDYEEYLKNGSRQMVEQWDNTIEKIRQRKMAALKKKEEQKKAEGLCVDIEILLPKKRYYNIFHSIRVFLYVTQ